MAKVQDAPNNAVQVVRDETVEERQARQKREAAERRKLQRKQALDRMTDEQRDVALKAEHASKMLVQTLKAQGHKVKTENMKFDVGAWRARFFVEVPAKVNGQSVRAELFAMKNRDDDLTGRIRFKVSSQSWRNDMWSSDAKDFREPKVRDLDYTKIAAVLAEYAAKKREEQRRVRHNEERRRANDAAAKQIKRDVGKVRGMYVAGSFKTHDDTELVKVTFEKNDLTPEQARKVAEAIKGVLGNSLSD